MVEINNQRKAFLDMLAWSEELITDVRKPEIRVYDVIVGGELLYWLLRSPSQTCHAKPKTQINRRRTLLSFFPVGGMPTASNSWKTSLRKVRTLWHCSRLKGVALTTVDRGDIRQANRVAAISGLHCRALVMVGSGIRLTAWLQNSKKRAEQSEKTVYEQSHRDYLRSWLSASSSACHMGC